MGLVAFALAVCGDRAGAGRDVGADAPRRGPAQARYLAACAALILMVATPAATSGLLSLADRPVDAVGSDASLGEPGTVAGGTDKIGSTRPRSLFLAAWLPPLVRPQTMLPRLVTVWVVGVAALTIRLLGGWPWCGGSIGGTLDEPLLRFAEVFGIRRGIRLLETSLVQVPMVIGGLRPVVLIPIAALTGLTPRQLEALLAHELAHIRRHDYLVNLVQSAIELLLFHHPAAWWASRVIRDEREHCCDDLAVRAYGDHLAYSRALATMEGLRSAPHLPLAASDGPLMARIRRILNPEIMSMSRLPIVGPGAALLIGLGLLAGGAAFQPGSPAIGAQGGGDQRAGERSSPGSDPLVRHVRTVFVPTFRSVSFRRDVQFRLTELVQKEIEKRTPYKVVGRLEEADTILEGTVNFADQNIMVEDPENLPRQLTATLQVSFNWVHNPPRAGERDRDPTLVSTLNFAPELGETTARPFNRVNEKLAAQIVDAGTRLFPWDNRGHYRRQRSHRTVR